MVKKDTFSTVNLFFKTGSDPKATKYQKILSKMHVINSRTSGDNMALDLQGAGYEDIIALLRKLLVDLNDRKRSQATVFEGDDVKCIVVKDCEILELAS